MTIWTRLAGQKLGAPVADPATGEIVAEAGEVLTRGQRRRRLPRWSMSSGAPTPKARQLR